MSCSELDEWNRTHGDTEEFGGSDYPDLPLGPEGKDDPVDVRNWDDGDEESPEEQFVPESTPIPLTRPARSVTQALELLADEQKEHAETKSELERLKSTQSVERRIHSRVLKTSEQAHSELESTKAKLAALQATCEVQGRKLLQIQGVLLGKRIGLSLNDISFPTYELEQIRRIMLERKW